MRRPSLVVGMRLAGEDELQAAARGAAALEARRVAEDQVAPLVRTPRGARSRSSARRGRGRRRCAARPRRAARASAPGASSHSASGASTRLADARVLPRRRVHAVGDRDDLGRAVDVAATSRARPRRGAARPRSRAATSRRPATVMLNGSPPICAHLPSTSSQAGAEPAELAEGVHLVAGGDGRVGREDDLLAHRLPGLARTAAPRLIRSAISSTPAKTAWPSLKWYVSTAMPSLRSARTPPTPSRISCATRAVERRARRGAA